MLKGPTTPLGHIASNTEVDKRGGSQETGDRIQNSEFRIQESGVPHSDEPFRGRTLAGVPNAPSLHTPTLRRQGTGPPAIGVLAFGRGSDMLVLFATTPLNLPKRL